MVGSTLSGMTRETQRTILIRSSSIPIARMPGSRGRLTSPQAMRLILSKAIQTRTKLEITLRWSQITPVLTSRMRLRSTLIQAGTSTKKTCIMFGYSHRAAQHQRLHLHLQLRQPLQLLQLLQLRRQQQLAQQQQLRLHPQRRRRRAREDVPRRPGHVPRQCQGP